MSDEEIDKSVEKCVTEEESEVEEESSPHLQVAMIRKKTELRHPRQKFCARWEKDFPWLKADKIDESVGFCVVCDKHLVCKKSHLERHEKSYKHQRLVPKFSSNDSDTQLTQPEFLECGKREYDDEYEQAVDMESDFKLEFEINKPSKKLKQSGRAIKNSPPSASIKLESPQVGKLDRFKLLKRIDRDRHELNEYYFSRIKSDITGTVAVRSSIDLFFESISASVKSLPPKLAAEVKSRVSQIMTEFELRAICEREASSNAAVATESPVVVASTTHEGMHPSNIGGPPVSHILYTYQPSRNKARD